MCKKKKHKKSRLLISDSQNLRVYKTIWQHSYSTPRTQCNQTQILYIFHWPDMYLSCLGLVPETDNTPAVTDLVEISGALKW